MKIILITLALGFGFIGIAQTSVIRLKSYHGDLAEIPSSTDKFGNPPIDIQYYPPTAEPGLFDNPVYDTLELINGTCVIQKGWKFSRNLRITDTLCDEDFEGQQQFIQDYYQTIYGDSITFVGFEKDQSIIQYKNNPYFNKRARKSSGQWLFLILVISGLSIYTLQPKFSWKK